MIEGEPRTIGVGVQIRYAERFRIGDDQAQHAETFRSISYSHLVVWRKADRDELGKRCPLAIQNSDCTIVSPRYGAGLLDDVSEQVWKVQVRSDEEHCLDDSPELGGILDRVEGHQPWPTCRQRTARRRVVTPGIQIRL